MLSPLSAFVILGPTACGKTQLSLQLAERMPCEIISLDSALVYQEMDIGTAKPTLAERNQVKHHLIDIISPLDYYSAADFVADCNRLIVAIQNRGKIPLIVGGTMMYYQALTQGLNQLPQADEQVRERLRQEKQQYGLAYLYQRLQKVDPLTAIRLKENDSQRIERALEVFELTGKPLSMHLSEQASPSTALNLYTLALIPENRQLLHTQINHRFHQMVHDGLLDELQRLRSTYSGLSLDKPSMRCVGYRQAWAYLDGATDRATFLAQGQAATRQLAKRQLTWLRKWAVDKVIDPYMQTDYVQAAYMALQQFIEQ